MPRDAQRRPLPSNERVELERDLYRNLLQLGRQRDVESFLREALDILVDLTGARRGYIQLGTDESHGSERSWVVTHGCESEEVETIRARVSRGIVAEAMSSGETVLTHSALLDARFAARESVQSAKIEAVLCAPLGTDPPLGVIYLDGYHDHQTFDENDRRYVECFAEHVGPLADRALLRELSAADAELTPELRALLESAQIIGRSAAFVDVLRTAMTVAPLDVHVLLSGDSGTGKTQLARLLHGASPRAARPFVELNCATLPEDLVENELFGADAGAHSTAQRAIKGKIAAAQGGTLFLDEISELPLGAQAKLLQFLQSKQFYPLGASAPQHSDARVIAATNIDLQAAVAARRFREDLMYRLAVLPIRLPSLAERGNDIESLIDHFLAVLPARHGLPSMELSPAARRAVRAAEWPGNIRQLEHALEAATIRAASERAAVVDAHHVFPGTHETGDPENQTYQEATRRFQGELVRRKLEECDWNVAQCARRLDLARSHVYKLIEAFGLSRDSKSKT